MSCYAREVAEEPVWPADAQPTPLGNDARKRLSAAPLNTSRAKSSCGSRRKRGLQPRKPRRPPEQLYAPSNWHSEKLSFERVRSRKLPSAKSERLAETRSTYTPPSYDIAPDDKQIAEGILAMDAFDDVASGASFPSSLKLSSLKTTALPPELRNKVEADLNDIAFDQRAGKEAELVAKAIRSVRGTTRRLIGNGPNALPYHSELLTIANEHEDAERESDRIFADLAEVSHHETTFNEVTGKQEAVPVFAVQGDRRRAMETRLKELAYKSSLLVDADGKHGIEAQRRLAKALQESVGVVKRQKQDAYELAEAKRRAVAHEQERRINERAEQFARHSRNEVL